MIQVSGIYVTFNPGTPLENPALRGIDLTIPQGQFVTVIGSNGAGKSTLLNALSGDVSISRGQVTIANKDVTHLPTEKRAALVARVFQDPKAGTCENLTIEENLSLAMLRGQKRGLGSACKRDFKARFQSTLLDLGLGLEDRLNDKMGLLSGGQRQAVSLLMATLQPMKILLLDEHTAALDPKTAEFVLNLTNKIIETQQLTALMVTHSMRQALDVGHRTIMLHEGKVAFDLQGEQREGLTVSDLLDLFARNKGKELSDDSLLLD